MLDRIDMNIVMPRSPLAERLCDILSFRARRREKVGLDQLAAHCKIGVTFGQRPYGVKMIRQHHDGIDREWMELARLTKRRAQ
ncbi:hypothetical protein AB8Z38_11900 [Bradyrhizobium sp. LLZ17]|uniref:Uncharacterized protein n=1 Tax=Bradyrhizobium sp. LLZ17 TaxID=3239388 RepID=A0AB39XS34_9BRAD